MYDGFAILRIILILTTKPPLCRTQEHNLTRCEGISILGGNYMKIMIDPGHDLHTPGKRGTKLKEFEFNSVVATYVGALLNDYGNVQIGFSHNLYDGIDDSLDKRVKAANNGNYNLFVSIHANAGPESARGIETFIHDNAPAQTYAIARAIHDHTINLTKQTNRGVKRANFQVLRETKMDAVLIECGFMTNPQDQDLLLNDNYRRLCAEGIKRGIVQHYNLKKKAAVQGGQEVNKNKLYRVQVGAFSVQANAQSLLDDVKKKGLEGYIVRY